MIILLIIHDILVLLGADIDSEGDLKKTTFRMMNCCLHSIYLTTSSSANSSEGTAVLRSSTQATSCLLPFLSNNSKVRDILVSWSGRNKRSCWLDFTITTFPCPYL